MKKNIVLGASALILLLNAHTANAAPTIDDLSARIAQLEKELAVLKRQSEVKDEVEQKSTENAASVEMGKNGLVVSSPDKNFTMKFGGSAQFDGRAFFNDDANTGRNEFLARRLRPMVEGTIYKDFSYRLVPDFAGGTTRVIDAYAGYKYSDAIKFRIGKFKQPVGLERLQSSADLFFMERGLPSNLTSDRDIGVQFHGEFMPELEYQIGVFNGGADQSNNNSDDDDKKDIAARLFAQPFLQSDTVPLQGLGVGIGGSIGDRDGTPAKTIVSSYRTPGQQTFFSYRTGAAADTAYASGTQWRIAPQAYYYYGNFGILGEYVVSSLDITRGVASETIHNQAWQLVGSYVLTGEDVNYKGSVIPRQAFDPRNGAWGAFEWVARIGQVNIDDNVFPVFADISRSASEATSLGTGFNWYLNQNIRLALNYDFTTFDGGATAGGDREDEQALFSRVQFRY